MRAELRGRRSWAHLLARPVFPRRAKARRREPPMASDEALVGKIRAGDERAFDELYTRYELKLFGFCLRALPTPRGRRGGHARSPAPRDPDRPGEVRQGAASRPTSTRPLETSARTGVAGRLAPAAPPRLCPNRKPHRRPRRRSKKASGSALSIAPSRACRPCSVSSTPSARAATPSRRSPACSRSPSAPSSRRCSTW